MIRVSNGAKAAKLAPVAVGVDKGFPTKDISPDDTTKQTRPSRQHPRTTLPQGSRCAVVFPVSHRGSENRQTAPRRGPHT